jgi:5-formyltetrahydrofolate cyclo-ligase
MHAAAGWPRGRSRPVPAARKRVADRKQYLRTILAETRGALSAAYAGRISAAVQARLLDFAAYRDCDTVVLYSPKDNEIGTEAIFADAMRSGRRVLFPRTIRERGELSLICVNDRAELRPGAFGLLEPSGAEIVRPAALERALICVPGVAFSPAGQRLGRGGGYYDRMLAAASRAITAGLAYSFQVLDRLPESPEDRRLDVIMTESAMHAAHGSPHAAAPRTDQGGVPRCW